MGKLPMKIKIEINYLKNLEIQMKKFKIQMVFFKWKLTESIVKPKDLWKALKYLGIKLPNKISACSVSALRINNPVKHDGNSVLEEIFKNYYSALGDNLAKNSHLFPLALLAFIKYYEDMIQGNQFNLVSAPKTSI